jgi:hypothetical protein
MQWTQPLAQVSARNRRSEREADNGLLQGWHNTCHSTRLPGNVQPEPGEETERDGMASCVSIKRQKERSREVYLCDCVRRPPVEVRSTESPHSSLNIAAQLSTADNCCWPSAAQFGPRLVP